MSGSLKVQFGDGVSAVDRTSRAIVILTAQALDHLETLGYDREKHTSLMVHEDGMPVWVLLRGKKVFEIDFDLGDNLPGLTIIGHWLSFPKRRWWGIRLWRLIVSRFRKKDA